MYCLYTLSFHIVVPQFLKNHDTHREGTETCTLHMSTCCCRGGNWAWAQWSPAPPAPCSYQAVSAGNGVEEVSPYTASSHSQHHVKTSVIDRGEVLYVHAFSLHADHSAILRRWGLCQSCCPCCPSLCAEWACGWEIIRNRFSCVLQTALGWTMLEDRNTLYCACSVRKCI